MEEPEPSTWRVEVATRDMTVVVEVITAGPVTDRGVPGVVVPMPSRFVVLSHTKPPSLVIAVGPEKKATWLPVPPPEMPETPDTAQLPDIAKQPEVRFMPPAKVEVAVELTVSGPPKVEVPEAENWPPVDSESKVAEVPEMETPEMVPPTMVGLVMRVPVRISILLVSVTAL